MLSGYLNSVRRDSRLHTQYMGRYLEGLVAWPLGGSHLQALLVLGNLASELSRKLSEGSLVVAHAHSEGLKVVELVGETHGTAVEEHEVASMVGHLVHLQHSLALHGALELKEKVLAE